MSNKKKENKTKQENYLDTYEKNRKPNREQLFSSKVEMEFQLPDNGGEEQQG